MLQNYNKILTKRTVFSVILESDQDLHKKKSAYFTRPDFSTAKIERKKKCANYASKYVKCAVLFIFPPT